MCKKNMAMFLKKEDSRFSVQCFGKESQYSTIYFYFIFLFFGERIDSKKRQKETHTHTHTQKTGLQ